MRDRKSYRETSEQPPKLPTPRLCGERSQQIAAMFCEKQPSSDELEMLKPRASRGETFEFKLRIIIQLSYERENKNKNYH